MGNGTRGTIAAAVAEALGIDPAELTVKVGDSSYVPGVMSGGSRTTPSMVPPAQDAARQLALHLLEVARDHFGAQGATIDKGGIRHASGLLSWKELLEGSDPVSFVGRLKADTGHYLLPFQVFDIKLGKGSTGAVQVTEVEVDTRLGRIRPVRTWLGIGAGRIVNRPLAQAQANSGIVLSTGYALFEDRRVDPRTAALLTRGLEDYRITGLGDVPSVEVHFDEQGYEDHLGGCVGLSELATMPGAAAMANAVYHATGWRPRELPMRPDRVLGALS